MWPRGWECCRQLVALASCLESLPIGGRLLLDMIHSLRISGFKLFRDIELPNLGGVNLFVGKNNSGKTCLLEAVELYSSSSPWDILRVASRREQDGAMRRKIERFDPYELGSSLQPLLNLFHREHERQPRSIHLSAGHPGADLKLECAPFLPEMLEMETFFSESGKPDPQARRKQLRHLLEAGFIVSRGEKKSRPLMYDRVLRRLPIPEEVLEAEGWMHPDSAPVASLPARGFTNIDAKRLWDKASLADKDELLLNWLRIIDPEIRDLRYLSDSDSGVDLPYLKINGNRGRTPLSSMGDGLTRLFHIGLAMANATGGILLIDEFENGLHWEVQKELWGALFKASKDFGIQVFATTHSTDCIRGFIAAQNEMLKLHKNFVYRLERRGEDVFALDLPALNLEAALHQQVEFR
jgi:hypothetical protein